MSLPGAPSGPGARSGDPGPRAGGLRGAGIGEREAAGRAPSQVAAPGRGRAPPPVPAPATAQAPAGARPRRLLRARRSETAAWPGPGPGPGPGDGGWAPGPGCSGRRRAGPELGGNFWSQLRCGARRSGLPRPPGGWARLLKGPRRSRLHGSLGGAGRAGNACAGNGSPGARSPRSVSPWPCPSSPRGAPGTCNGTWELLPGEVKPDLRKHTRGKGWEPAELHP